MFVCMSAVQQSRRCLNSGGVHSWQDGIVLEACNNKQLTQFSEICPISSSVSLSIYTHSSSSSHVYFQTVSMSLCWTYLSVCCMYRCVETWVYLYNSWAYRASLGVEAHLGHPTQAVLYITVCYVKKHRVILGCGGLKFKLTNVTGSNCQITD